MVYLWVAIVIILTVVEVITIDLVTVWFVISGLATIITSLFTDNFIIQLAIFTILGLFLLITTRPTLKKYLKTRNVKTNFDRIIDMEGVVTQKISKNEVGEVKVDGKKWSAIADNSIEEGCTVKILEIIGVKVKVKEI